MFSMRSSARPASGGPRGCRPSPARGEAGCVPCAGPPSRRTGAAGLPRAAALDTVAARRDMPNAVRLLRADLREKARWCYGSDDVTAIAKTIATDGTSAMILYRLMQGARDARLTPLELAFNKLNSVINHCVIGRGAAF